MMFSHTVIFSSFSLLFVVGLSFIVKPPTDCSQYKVGKFYVYNKVSKQKVNIERKDSLQIETNTETGDIIIMKVSWRSECEYELLFNYVTPKEVSKSKRTQTVVETSVDIPLRIKILSGTDDYYVYEATKQGFKPSRDTVWLVKEFSSAFTK
jgi:hypothetical protein